MSQNEDKVRVQQTSEAVAAEEQALADKLAEKAAAHDLRFLLSFHDDGVVWGRWDGQTWKLSSRVAPNVSPAFRALTLQECRAFGESAELYLYRDGSQLRGYLLREGEGEELDYFSEAHLLWGDQGKEADDGFTVLREGRQGLRHAIPIALNNLPQKAGNGRDPHLAQLRVRHYIGYAPDDRAYIRYSRLVAVEERNES